MNFTLKPFSQLDPVALARLAALHQSVMHTLLADLGLPVVLRYYQVCQRDPAVIGFCAVSPAGEMLGWAVGSPHPDEVNARLRQPIPWFAGQMLRLAFTRPGALWQLAVSTLSTLTPAPLSSHRGNDWGEGEKPQIELTYIGVAASARGQGLGRGLLIAFVEASRAAGYSSIALSVETDNPEAIGLYGKSGFKIIRTFREGRFERHRMELLI